MGQLYYGFREKPLMGSGSVLPNFADIESLSTAGLRMSFRRDLGSQANRERPHQRERGQTMGHHMRHHDQSACCCSGSLSNSAGAGQQAPTA